MTDKIKIQDVDIIHSDLSRSVCLHLQGILSLLEVHGISYDKSLPLYTDKGGAHTLYVDGNIDFDLVKEHFEIPSFIEISQKYQSIICRKCWCDISEKNEEYKLIMTA